MRRFDIKIGEQYSFTTYNKNKLRDIDLYIEKIESLRTAYINTDCFVVVPRAKGPGPLLKHQWEMKIWFTFDKKHLKSKEIKLKKYKEVCNNLWYLIIIIYENI